MKCLLIFGTELIRPSVHKQMFEVQGPVYPPLGLLYVGRSLEDEGHKVEIIDYFVEKQPFEEIKKRITSSDIIGLSVDNDTFYESAQIARSIKNIDCSIPIIIGGPHCTLYPERSLSNLPEVDISVCGDGEQAIKDITNALDGKKKLANIPGIHYRGKDNEIHVGQPPQLIENLDEITFPARHLIDKYEYGRFGNTFYSKPKLTSMITTRGCPFRCKYCLRHVISYNSFRQRSAENVLAEFKEINDKKFGSVMVADDTFLVNKKRAHKILDGLIEMGSSAEILIGGTRADLVDPELYKKMKKAGVKHISFGIESGNQEVLDFYRKDITIDQIRNAIKLSNKMGFFVNGSFIIGAPMETQEHIENTIKFSCSLNLDSASFYPLSYRHGSDLWKDAVKQGFIPEEKHEIIADIKYNLAKFSEKEILHYCSQAMRRFYIRPGFILQHLKKACKNNDFRILRMGIETLLRPVYYK